MSADCWEIAMVLERENKELKARVRALEAQAALLDAVLARRAMEKALDVWDDTNYRITYSHLYSLALNEVRLARELEDAVLDAALAARKGAE
jgi:hypothetical protein